MLTIKTEGVQLRGIDLDILEEDVPDLISESHDGIARVIKIIQDLHAFAQLSGSQSDSWSSLSNVMESVLNVHRLGVSDAISLSRIYGTSPEINCRPSELAEVFEVLINNAIEAIEHAHGQINILSGADGNSAWIEVEDNGKGIDPEHLNKLFDPFFTTKKVGAGVGMSLAKAYSIVRKHR